MKKFILLLILICLGVYGYLSLEEKLNLDEINKNKNIFTTIIKRDKIIIGVRDDAVPFGFRDEKGNLAGFDVDLAEIIAESLLGSKNKVELVPVNAQNRIMKLKSGEVDMLVAAMSTTRQRWQLVDFSKPYYLAGLAIMTKKSNPAIGLKSLRKNKFIVVYGSTAEESLRKNVPDIEVIGFKTYKEAFQALQAGEAEGIYADDTILYGLARGDDSVKILAPRYSKEPYAVAVRKEDSAELLERINFIIENLEKTKRLEKLAEKWDVDN